ncbi:hypothetical protein AFCDBAGC_0960 [Methylobacterium cerastii]|uniref:DUF1223 domain-containing protein n=2 Tax=Methylobacterium TaxID=407 RepID=A0ABQ4QDQ2_9HYPH|nr:MULTISPECIES: DUF1223 domain-containing protein [Methylobacterium]TXN84451.1 DUF1223 domain-containing protein [Methylobacterium sp. WL8]GJD43116.1 hypothetical protein AFCDBAGC_0960 [Methylobacterium cerastii]
MRSITRSTLRRTIPLALLAALIGSFAGTRADAAGRPVVVELFTSQSCSSCPPAEALLGQLAGEGREVLPLAFHVTYWDHLDWRDTYALPAATARQAAYAKKLGGGSYTPEAVIDGRVGLVGSDAGAVRGAIATAHGAASAEAPVTLARRGGTLVVAVGAGQGGGTVTLVGFDPSHATRVARGENAGRTIAQANVVRAVSDLGRWSGQAATWETPLPAGADAAVIVQGADGRIFGAARLGPAT